jgi:hypothetical protein
MLSKRRPGVVVLVLGLGLGAWACGSPSAVAPTATADPFVVVRATAQAAYVVGKDYVARGDVVRGCPLIDTAMTNDPDQRPEIRAELERCLQAIANATPAAAATLTTPATRTVPTVPALAKPAAATVQAGTTSQPAATRPAGATVQATAISQAAATAVPTDAPAAANLVPFQDRQSRCAIGAPPDWTRADGPAVLFGTGVVEFHDASGQAALSVAVDATGRVVSPELYAASMELSMQQVPGYALEQVQPGTTAGNPSVKRILTFTQRDSAGGEVNARAFQLTVLKGSTPYILTASAPADQFARFAPIFDRMVDSFRFS